MVDVSLGYLFCCGWGELHGIQTYKTSRDLTKILTAISNHRRRGGWLFTYAGTRRSVKNNGAERLAKALRNKKLGEVTELPQFRNPNTGHLLCSYVWIVDYIALDAYYKEKKLGKYAPPKLQRYGSFF
jgi:hypothetical protein